MKSTHKLAIGIAAALTVWMTTGLIFPSYEKDEDQKQSNTQTPADIPKVRIKHLVAELQNIEITLRGRTEAKRIVDVKAEMAGRVISTPVEKGARVKKGAVLCQLAEDAYGAILAQSKASYDKALIDYDGAQKLKEKGLLSASNVAANKANLENAKANLKMAQVNVEHLSIRAPFAGFIEGRPTDVGALIKHGETCAHIIDESTILATGQVSEKEVSALTIGLPVTAQLSGGGFIKGIITFIGRTANTQTRTYRVEATLKINGDKVRDGSTLQMFAPLEKVMAYQISPAVLALDDEGLVGVRLVNNEGIVEFHQVQIVKESMDGVWVTGLPAEINLITIGQEFVTDGDKVGTALDQLETDTSKKAENQNTAASIHH